MSCYRCAEKFRLFKKEIGCANCGFGFCSKCCNYKTNVPKKDNKILNVCLNCYNSLTTNESKKNDETLNKDTTPPKNFLKMVESNKLKSNQNDEVHCLEKRLENLKCNKSNNKSNSLDDLEARLNKLQGRNEQYQKLSNLPSKEVIKTPEDLITKLTEQVDIDKNYEEFEKSQLEKLEARLKNLKSKPSENIEMEKNQEPIDPVEKTQVDPNEELIKKFLNEAEESYKKTNNETQEDSWCCLCNQDANLICIDCDNDLYCNRCYK